VDFAARDIRLDDSKTREPRYLSFASHPRLAALLERQDGVRQALQAQGIISPWVFPHKNGDRVSRGALQFAWRQARKAAGIVAAEGPFIHGLRRKMSKELLDAGVSEIDAMTITGHRTLSTFRRYAIRDRAAQDRALALLESNRTDGRVKTERFRNK
jgi:integrase